MPLIILTGYPCSGLTFRAYQLAALIEQIQDAILKENPSQFRYKVKIIETHSATRPRSVYDDARFEKETRAVAYGHIKRALGRDTIVISDGMNYIKGWRYQLWCEAKAAGTTSCVVNAALRPHLLLAIAHDLTHQVNCLNLAKIKRFMSALPYPNVF
ncbi:hypothetical protein KEM55_005758 [Ascosphaera atra]|nr:hypothetical protein KEM55_005758 [Ascosphaera atra]